MKGLVTSNTHVQYESPTSSGKKVMAKVKVFSKVGQTSRSKSQGQKLWYHVKGLVTRNTHVQYESPTTSGKKVMAKVKFFKSKSNFKVKVMRLKNYCTMRKVLSQEIHMCNIKALPLLVRKLWPRLKFFKSRSNFKVKVTRSKIMVPCPRSCHKKYTCAI